MRKGAVAYVLPGSAQGVFSTMTRHWPYGARRLRVARTALENFSSTYDVRDDLLIRADARGNAVADRSAAENAAEKALASEPAA